LGVPQDYNKAVGWYEQAAQAGDPEGQYRLAGHLQSGLGVARNPVRASTIYKQCADSGDARCLNNLGLAMLHGNGAPVNKVLAVRYFEAAAAKGQANAITSLADCYENGNGVPVDLVKAVGLYTDAAKKGLHIAHASLGSLFERGLGLPRNDVYAAMHYQLATGKVQGNDNSYYRQEYDKAKAALDRIEAALSSEQLIRARALAERWPNVPRAETEVGIGSGVGQPASLGRLTKSAIVGRLSSATALVIGLTEEGLVTGSAFWIAPGLLITNRHVVENLKQDSLFVIRSGSSKYLPGMVVAVTNTSDVGEADIAVLRVPITDAMVSLSFSPAVGLLSDVVASGFPGFAVQGDRTFWNRLKANDWTAPSNVVTSGQVASVQRPNGQAEIIMHTAQIYSGNSGGPLVDYCGRIVGMNTYRLADSKHQEQANYAISASTIMIFLRDHGIPFRTAPGDCS
jgi:TPR repeat protein